MSRDTKISDTELRRILSERAMAVAAINDVRNAYRQNGVKGAVTKIARIIEDYDVSMGILEALNG